MDFTLDPAYFSSVTIHEEWNQYTKGGREPTPEEILLILAGKGNYTMTSSADHPEFTRLRELLGQLGYIRIERGWWNGDRVLKPFTLNGLKFNVGKQFSCASAMSIQFKVRKDHPEYYKDDDDVKTTIPNHECVPSLELITDGLVLPKI